MTEQDVRSQFEFRLEFRIGAPYRLRVQAIARRVHTHCMTHCGVPYVTYRERGRGLGVQRTRCVTQYIERCNCARILLFQFHGLRIQL